MKKIVDLRGNEMTEAIAFKTENVLSQMGFGEVSFLLNSSLCTSYVSLVAHRLGWEVALDYRRDCYTLHLSKELEEEACA